MISGAGCALDGSVLVLNKFFTAVHVVSVRRAFCLLFKELAEVITIDDGQYVAFNFSSWCEASQARSLFKGPDDELIRTVHFEIEVPRIIRLLAYDRLPRQKVKFNRRNIFARDGNRCQYCGRKFATSELQPRPRCPAQPGRPGHLEEYRLRLPEVQRAEGGRTPREASMRLYREPAEPQDQPMLRLKLSHRKYRSWKAFLDNAYWSLSWNEPGPAGGMTRRPALIWTADDERAKVDDSETQVVGNTSTNRVSCKRISITT